MCGFIGPLTRDHIPPQSLVPAQPVDVRLLTELWNSRGQPSTRRAFRSVSIPSLCRACNSDRLGAQFDPALLEFAGRAITWVRAAHQLWLSLPDEFTIQVRPHRVARAVVGHLLAAEHRKNPSEPLRRAPMLDEMREYFLGDGSAPETFELYVWPCAGDTQVVARSLNVTEYGHSDSLLGDVLKFFPLGFWLIYQRPASATVSVPQLPIHEMGGLDDVVSITLPLTRVPRPDWPEAPGKMGMVFMNDQMTFTAQPARRRSITAPAAQRGVAFDGVRGDDGNTPAALSAQAGTGSPAQPRN